MREEIDALREIAQCEKPLSFRVPLTTLGDSSGCCARNEQAVEMTRAYAGGVLTPLAPTHGRTLG